MPRAVLELPRAEVPSYSPMIAPPSSLRPPPGVAKEGEKTQKKKEEPKQEPPAPPEVTKINIPWINREIPVPKEEIVVAASVTAVASVVATLTATSLFNWVLKIAKPVVKQILTRVEKKFGRGRTEEESTTEN